MDSSVYDLGLPPTIPPLVLVPTGEKLLIDGKYYILLKIERDLHFKENPRPDYKNIKRQPLAKHIHNDVRYS